MLLSIMPCTPSPSHSWCSSITPWEENIPIYVLVVPWIFVFSISLLRRYIFVSIRFFGKYSSQIATVYIPICISLLAASLVIIVRISVSAGEDVASVSLLTCLISKIVWCYSVGYMLLFFFVKTLSVSTFFKIRLFSVIYAVGIGTLSAVFDSDCLCVPSLEHNKFELIKNCVFGVVMAGFLVIFISRRVRNRAKWDTVSNESERGFPFMRKKNSTKYKIVVNSTDLQVGLLSYDPMINNVESWTLSSHPKCSVEYELEQGLRITEKLNRCNDGNTFLVNDDNNADNSISSTNIGSSSEIGTRTNMLCDVEKDYSDVEYVPVKRYRPDLEFCLGIILSQIILIPSPLLNDPKCYDLFAYPISKFLFFGVSYFAIIRDSYYWLTYYASTLGTLNHSLLLLPSEILTLDVDYRITARDIYVGGKIRIHYGELIPQDKCNSDRFLFEHPLPLVIKDFTIAFEFSSGTSTDDFSQCFSEGFLSELSHHRYLQQHSEYIVKFVGVCVDPPHISIMMERCELGTVLNFLHQSSRDDVDERDISGASVAMTESGRAAHNYSTLVGRRESLEVGSSYRHTVYRRDDAAVLYDPTFSMSLPLLSVTDHHLPSNIRSIQLGLFFAGAIGPRLLLLYHAALALSHCHSLRCIHRDIKTDNIFLKIVGNSRDAEKDEFRKFDMSVNTFDIFPNVWFVDRSTSEKYRLPCIRAVLGDFGTCITELTIGKSHELIGTPGYVAPDLVISALNLNVDDLMDQPCDSSVRIFSALSSESLVSSSEPRSWMSKVITSIANAEENLEETLLSQTNDRAFPTQKVNFPTSDRPSDAQSVAFFVIPPSCDLYGADVFSLGVVMYEVLTGHYNSYSSACITDKNPYSSVSDIWTFQTRLLLNPPICISREDVMMFCHRDTDIYDQRFDHVAEHLRSTKTVEELESYLHRSSKPPSASTVSLLLPPESVINGFVGLMNSMVAMDANMRPNMTTVVTKMKEFLVMWGVDT